MLESEKIQKEKDLAGAAKTLRSLGAPDSVRCTNQPEDPTVGCTRNGRRSTLDMLQWLSGAPPDRKKELPSLLGSNGSKSSTVGCAKLGRRSALDSEQGMSGGAPDCPVRHPTEGKNCLP